jgi:hypothetical protein
MGKLEIIRGDTPSILIRMVLKNGSPLPLAGFKVVMTAKKKTSLPDSKAIFSIPGVVTDPDGGYVRFDFTTITSNQLPGDYLFDVQASNPVTRKVYSNKPTAMKVIADVTLKSL